MNSLETIENSLHVPLELGEVLVAPCQVHVGNIVLFVSGENGQQTWVSMSIDTAKILVEAMGVVRFNILSASQ